MAETVLVIGLLVFAAHFFTSLFDRTRVPDVLMLTLMGVLLGPVFHLVSPHDFGGTGQAMSTMALVVILFEGGLSLNPQVLARTFRPILKLTFSTFVITVGLGFLLAKYLLHVPDLAAWCFGICIGGTSVAVVIPMVKSLRITDPMGTVLVMESALGDVISVVVLVSVLQGAAAGGLHPAKMIGGVVASILMAGMIGLLGGLVWAMVLNQVRKFPNSVFTTLAFVMILFGAADMLGYSGAVAALAFGATLSNYQFLPLTRIPVFHNRELGAVSRTDVAFYMEILFLLKTFFFVYLGVSIPLSNPLLAAYAFGLVAAVYLLRLLLVRLMLIGENASWKDLGVTAFMAPKGLVSAVLAGLLVVQGIEGAVAVQQFTYLVVVASIFITAGVVPLLEINPGAAVFRRIFRNKAHDPALEPTLPVTVFH